VADRLGKAERLLTDAQGMDATLAGRSEELKDVRYGVEELARFFADYGRGLEHNPERLAEIIERLETIGLLKRKYGGSLASVIEYRESAEKELALSSALQASISILADDIAAARVTLAETCAELSADRKIAAQNMEEAIQEALAEVGMPNARFSVHLSRQEAADGEVMVDGSRFRATASGIETAEFYCSMNPGEETRPLVKVASGGEISRIMLAMKSVLSQTHSVQVLIFDEIDMGISGRIAEVVGRKLQNLAKATQTVSITHLPQIAKMADRHFSARKDVADGRTQTRVTQLSADERAEELAKLLGGEKISELTMEHAREMLSQN
jgi:DNA repair protein RecN (Recombination protein N)